jgi:hypothetical protein
MRTAALHHFCSWLEETPVSLAIQSAGWIVPTVQTIHIIAIAAVVSSVLMIDLRLAGLASREQSLVRVIARFRPVIWAALPILLATGIVMIAAEPARSLENPVFQLKMLLLVAAILITLAFSAPLTADPAFWERSLGRRAAAAVVVIASLLLWIGIIFAGRWIAYYM